MYHRILYLVSCLLAMLPVMSYGQTVTNTLYNDQTFNAKTIDQSKPVGVIEGAGSVTLTGAATYTIPIKCPPGTNGMTPKIALTYNSQSGNGILGMGWSLSGISAISRVPKDFYHDGVVAPMSFSKDDMVALDGNRLVILNAAGSYGSAGSTYRLENDNFSKITVYDNGGNRWYRLITKDGMKMDYGGTSDSRFLNSSVTNNTVGTQVMIWRLNKIEDINGNYMTFEYSTNSSTASRTSVLTAIKYTGNGSMAPYNEIRFSYTNHLQPNIIYENGESLNQSHLLTKIESYGESGMVHTYELNYGHNNVTTFLKEVIEKDANKNQLNSTIFKYGATPSNTLVTNVLGVVNNNIEYITGDYNGDGLTDLLTTIKQGDDYLSFSVSKATNTGFQWDKNVSLPSGSRVATNDQTKFSNSLYSGRHIRRSVETNYAFSYQSFDFQGDGYEDLLTVEMNQINGSFSTLSAIRMHYGNPDSVLCGVPNQITIPQGYDMVRSDVPFIYPGDFDGDGTTDFICFQSNGVTGTQTFLYRYNQSPVQISKFPIGGTSVPSNWLRFAVIDFDGDGKNELMAITGNQSYLYTFTKQSNGTIEGQLLRQSNYPSGVDRISFGDFNGDKKTDLLTGTNTGQWKLALSTGIDFSISSFNFTTTPDWSLDDIMIGDYNGDGRSDILHTNKCGSACEGYVVYYSTGAGFHHEIIAGSYDIDMTGISIGDFNGDGTADLLYRYPYGAAYAANIVYFKKNSKELLLEKIKDGFERVTSFNYKPLTDGGAFYLQGSSYNSHPVNFIRPAMNAVSSFSVPDGKGGVNTTSYFYENAAFHKGGRGFLGFKKVTSINTVTDAKTESYSDIDNTYYVLHQTENRTLMASTNQQLSSTTYNISFEHTTGNAFYQRLNSSTELNSLTGATTTTTNTYNLNGDITQSVVNINNVETITTVMAYIPAGLNNVNRPSDIGVVRKRGSAASVDDVHFVYDPVGRLQKKTEFSPLANKRITTYSYDNFGNIISETLSGTGIPYTATTTTNYDSKGRFPVNATNPLSQKATTTWDYQWGQPLQVTGIDGVQTTNTYNSWGKLTSSTVKSAWLNIQYTVTYSDGWDLANGSVYYTKVVHPGRPDVKTWYDILGREISTETEHFNNKKLYTSNTYNNKGQLHTSVAPHLSSETGIVTTNTYDAYGLLASSTNDFGTTTHSYSYGSGKTTHTVSSPKGQTITVADAAGRVLEQTDNGGKITFTYDSRGNVLAVKQGVITLLANSYDAYGRKVSLNDCDAGMITYEYDAWGRLKKETDAKGQKTEFRYNEMNMLLQRDGVEGTTTYEYYDAGNGYANQVKKVTGFGGEIDEFDYDWFGRLVQKKRTIDNKVFETGYSYNNYGDVEDVTYNTGFSYKNNYDANGFLTSITTNWPGQPVTMFTATDMNGFGQYTDYTYGNNAQTTNTYDKGFLTHTLTPGIQDMSFTFDIQTGNLMRRADDITQHYEDFTYDNLNRLTSSTVTRYNGTFGYSAAPVSVTYDQTGTISQGNIIAKTDVGGYNYGGFPKHAVKYTDNTAGNISVQQQDITYTAFRKAAKVTENGYEQSFIYDAGYERSKSVLKQNGTTLQTRYYMGDWEYNVNGNSYTYYVRGGDGLCAIVEHCTSIYAPVKKIHYVYKDHLGSILTVTDGQGNIEAEQNFDAWGRFRDPHDWTDYNNIPTSPLWLYRGYTAHEHMQEFGLINMNGRMYDPLLGRMLSPDIYTYEGSQGYNRFSYCFNNPLNCIDPSGESFFLLPMASYDAKNGWDFDITFGYDFGGAGVYGNVGYSEYNSNWRFGVGAYAGGFTANVSWGTQTGWSAYAGVGMFGFGSGLGSNVGTAGLVWSEQSGLSVSALGFTLSSYGLSAGMSIGYSQNIWRTKIEAKPVYYACNDCGDYTAYHLPEVIIRAYKFPWMYYAKSQLGQSERSPGENSAIIAYHSTTGGFNNDETPWCSSFVNWCFTQSGIAGTNSARAYSWKSWGQNLDRPAYGALAVMNYSHVGFVAGMNKDGRIILLGGNQGSPGSVNLSPNQLKAVITYRYPNGYKPNYDLPMYNMRGRSLTLSSTR